jgi:hypothetical protein
MAHNLAADHCNRMERRSPHLEEIEPDRKDSLRNRGGFRTLPAARIRLGRL